ncbi:MAG: DUF4340 domain-containing protein [Proteobacteria bacterium]|nr:DUF4340 domain-containing protein [Pseudomonadota bacterium]
MIKPQHFMALALGAVCSLVLAVGVYAGANRWSAGKVEGAQFLPELTRNINSVAAIEVTQGGQTLTIDRSGNSWKVRDRSGFPAKAEVARALLVALTQSQLVEPKTAVKDKLALLELEDPAGKAAKSRRIRVLDSSGKAISDVVLGKTKYDAFGSGKPGLYVRRVSEAQSWLATGEPKATAAIKDWIDTRAFTTDATKISKVTIETAGEAPLVIEKGPPPAEPPKETKPDEKPAAGAPKPPAPPAAKYHLASKLPDGKKLKKDVSVDTVADAFASIDLDDIRKLDATPSGDKVQVIRLEQDGGPSVTFRLRKDGDASWLSFSAAGEGEAKKKADEINARAQGWEMKIPSWKADQIGKRPSDLFEAAS